NLPSGFVYIKDVIPNIQCEVRYYTDDNFIGQNIDGYIKPRCILSIESTNALKKVQEELNAQSLALRIYDAYRPQKAVDHFVRWARDLDDTKMKSSYYPEVDKRDLFKNGYIAEKSGHSRGSTVDLTIISLQTKEPQELDMGTTWDFFGPQSWPASEKVTLAQRSNRMLLQNTMMKFGFMPIEEEWWHFTLENEPFPNEYFNFDVK
ncbi:MAG: D-alanyl-D-alanine dipeptidase, partial [Planctomycetota bacterium]